MLKCVSFLFSGKQTLDICAMEAFSAKFQHNTKWRGGTVYSMYSGNQIEILRTLLNC